MRIKEKKCVGTREGVLFNELRRVKFGVLIFEEEIVKEWRMGDVKALREILESRGIKQCPICFDALSAKLVQNHGFPFCFAGGFAMSAVRLGLPDTGLISYGEMVDQGQLITQAVSIPVIVDADNGYGNALNVKRTVKGYIKAGFAGIMLEDQVSPKACGHTQGKGVVSREEAVMRIKAAVDARKESGSDIVIVARTDSRQAVSLDEALIRTRAFADAGADALFIDALASNEEMKAFCEVCPKIPKMANMLEGGKTPILSALELEDIGYKFVVYPISLLGVSIRAMQDALTAIKGGSVPSPRSMPSFEEIKDIVGFNAYYEEEKRYTSSTNLRISEKDSSNVSFSGIWSRTLRIKLTGRDGFEKLDLRSPARFVAGITNIIPGLGGVNIKTLLDGVGEDVEGKVLLDVNDSNGDRIQVFVE